MQAGARRRSMVRATRAGTDDPRSVQTRAWLCAAFERVLVEDGYGAATVSRIAAEAGVSRGAFYDHFSSPVAVAVEVVESLYESIAEVNRRARRFGTSRLETTRSALERLAAHMSENSAMYRDLLLSSAAPGAVLTALLEKFAVETVPAVREARPDLDDRDASRAAHLIAGAVLSTLIWWLRESEPAEPSVIAQDLMDLMPEWFVDPSGARKDAEE
ncbi:TetR/AcrR family transcriptional regulator [Catenulispora pinisilvae]|uniref:TetR/AcrR family transcriptional regulator n=1 Tax=Catenulispora pinisilvae TaxID=2705253 RepID=UPI001E6075F2|nr:TetR/AcrR family transcriptional regulator [Catenulispora pinisilvae]